MEEELQKILKKDFVNLFTRENVIGFLERRIDRNVLIENIANFGQFFYVCGPDQFVKSITGYLFDLGATADCVVIEE